MSFKVSGGTNGSTGGYEIALPIDLSTIGWITNNEILASVAASVDTGETLTANIKSAVSGVETVGMSAVPTSTNLPINYNETVTTLFTFNFANWLREPGTTASTVISYPPGAEVTGYPVIAGVAAVNNPALGTLTYTFDVNDDGALVGIPVESTVSSVNVSLKIKFRNDVTGVEAPLQNFAPGEDVTVSAASYYTLVGDVPAQGILQSGKTMSITKKLVAPSIHLEANKFSATSAYALNGSLGLDIDYDSWMEGTTFTGINNAGGADIDDIHFTWYNDSSYKKARLRVLRTDGSTNLDGDGIVGTAVNKYIFYIDGGISPRTFTHTPNMSNNLFYNLENMVSLLPGEYFDKVEIYPYKNNSAANGSSLGLTVGSSRTFTFDYSTWPNGEFPSGTDMNENDESNVYAEVTWNDEADSVSHTNPVAVNSGSTYKLSTDGLYAAPQTIRYYKNTPAPTASFNGISSSGTTVNANLHFENNFYESRTYWQNPVLYFALPQGLTLPPGQETKIIKMSGVDYKITTEATTLGGNNGKPSYPAYKVTIKKDSDPNDTVLIGRLTGLPGGDIPYTFELTDDSLSGIHYFSQFGIYGWSGNLRDGISFGTSEGGNNVTISGASPNYAFDDNLWDLDNDSNTSRLRVNLTGSYSVARRPDSDIGGYLFNNLAGDDGEWQLASSPDAKATIAPGSTSEGKFQLVVENLSNMFIGDLRLLDILPFEGDMTALNPTVAKNSEWEALLKSELNVKVIDKDENDITNQYLIGTDYNITYSTQKDPTYNGGVEGIARTSTSGSGNFAGSGTFDTAHSFLFQLNGGNRLAPGAKIVITGTVKAPDSVTMDDLEKAAYNSFAAQASYYENPTGASVVARIPAFIPTAQKIVITDLRTAKLTKSAVVFKDIDKNNLYSATSADEVYSGTSVHLYKASGGAIIGNPIDETLTDENGQYEFKDLLGGDYIVKFDLPSTTYHNFSTIGDTGNSAASHVNQSGLSDVIRVNPGQTLASPPNAGIQVSPKLIVEFREGTKTGSLVRMDTVTDEHATYKALVTPLPISGSVVTGPSGGPGVTKPFTLPDNYHLVNLFDATKAYSLTWENPSVKIVFPVELNKCTVTYAAGGSNVTGLPGGATLFVGGSHTVSSSVPSRSGYTFNGWVATSGISGNYSGGESFTMPTSDVVLTASWTVVSEPPIVTPPTVVDPVKYTVNYDGGGTNVTGLPVSALLEAGDSYTVSKNIPVRSGYTFIGWIMTSGGSGNYSGGNSFTMPASDVVLTASWEAVPTVPPVVDPPIDPPVVNPVSVTHPTVVTPEEEPIDEAEIDDADPVIDDPATGTAKEPIPNITSKTEKKLAAQTGNPITDLLNGNVPLGGITATGAWSLLSLILSLIAVVVSALLVISAILRRKDDERPEDEIAGQARNDAGARDDVEGDSRRRGKILKVLAIVFGVLTPIVWIILDNFNQPMIFINKWTVYVGLVFVLHIVLLVVYKVRKGQDDRDDNGEYDYVGSEI